MNDRPVTLFTHSTCVESPLVRQWLELHGISFKEISLDQDDAGAEALNATGLFVVPLLIVGDQKLIGYDPKRLASLFPE